MFFRGNQNYEVTAFTAAQIAGISGRKYLGIPIFPEHNLPELIKKFKVDIVVLAYSDLPYMHVMHKAAIANAAGADFWLLGPNSTQLKSKKPVIAVGAVRTGCGKSQTTMKIAEILKKNKKKVVVIRHPMPYGDLSKQIAQRFETFADLDKYECTVEEREEYEPHIDAGNIAYAGTDYEKILKQAEAEADIIIWDGGNNDFPFIKPDLFIVLADPLRPGNEKTYYPGEVNARLADVVIINKEKSAKKKHIDQVEQNIRELNPGAMIIHADSRIVLRKPVSLAGKKVLVVEDGPTLTHGGMSFGAGFIAAQQHKCEIVDPRPYAVGEIAEVFKEYKRLGKVLPAMGYRKGQLEDMEKTINAADCDFIINASPIHLRRLLKLKKPVVGVRYELAEKGITVEDILKTFKFI